MELRRFAVALFVCMATVLLFSRSARAQVPAYNCPATATYYPEPYTWKIGYDEYSDAPVYPIKGYVWSNFILYNRYRYNNQQNIVRWIVANRNITSLQLNFAYASTEANWDYLEGSTVLGPSGWTQTGATVTNFAKYNNPTGSLQRDPVKLVFNSDYSVVARGINISSAGMACNGASDNNFAQIGHFHHVNALLGGFDDNVVYTIPGSTDPLRHYTLAMWHSTWFANNGPNGEDADIYVQCGAVPSTSAPIQSAQSGNREFVHWTAASFPCATQYYIRVRSYPTFGGSNGRFSVNLLSAIHASSEHREIRARVDSFDPTVLASVQTLLQRTAAYMYAASQGQSFFDFHLWQGLNLPNNPCYLTPCGSEACQFCGDAGGCGAGATFDRDIGFGYGCDQVNTQQYAWRMVHELGHYRYRMKDGSRTWKDADGLYRLTPLNSKNVNDDLAQYTAYNACGHSMMTNSFLNHRFCTGYDHLYNHFWVKALGNEPDETNVLPYVDAATTVFNDNEDGICGPFFATYQSLRPKHYYGGSDPIPHSDVGSDFALGLELGRFLTDFGRTPDAYEFNEFVGQTGFPGLTGTN